MTAARMMHFALFVLGLAITARATTGDGTAYSGDGQKDATGRNACGYGNLGSRWEKYYAALPTRCWSGSYCGRCIRARGIERGATGKWVTVKVVDQCASCKCGDVDLSSRAFKEITGYEWDRKRIEWEWTDCGGSSAVSAASKKGGQGAKCKRNGDCASGFACSKSKRRCYRKRSRRGLMQATAGPLEETA